MCVCVCVCPCLYNEFRYDIVLADIISIDARAYIIMPPVASAREVVCARTMIILSEYDRRIVKGRLWGK